MAQLELQHVSKHFGDVKVIEALDLSIKDGEFVVVVGPSGCGKSTVLRLIAGLEAPTQGRILMDGQYIDQVSPKDRDMAMVFQHYALYPHMSVYDNMAFALKMRKMNKAAIDEQVRRAADMLELTDYLKRKPKALSGGQRQRVALGRAIVRNPNVFLMDEPLSNLDAKLRVTMRREIIELHKKLGVTTLYVTHDQEEALTMGDRIAVLKDGYLQQFDTPQNLYQFPKNQFVGNFIGQMNFIPAKVEGNVAILAHDTSFQLPAGISTEDDSVVIGIRPNFFTTDIAENTLTINVEPTLIEHLGHEQRLHFDWGGVACVALISSQALATVGNMLTLGIQTESLSYFSASTGLSLHSYFAATSA